MSVENTVASSETGVLSPMGEYYPPKCGNPCRVQGILSLLRVCLPPNCPPLCRAVAQQPFPFTPYLPTLPSSWGLGVGPPVCRTITFPVH